MKNPRKVISFNTNRLSILAEIEINKNLHFVAPSIKFRINDGSKNVEESVFDEDHTRYYFYINDNNVLTALSRNANTEIIEKYKNELVIDPNINSYVYEKINKLVSDNFCGINLADSSFKEIVDQVIKTIKELHYPLYLLFFS